MKTKPLQRGKSSFHHFNDFLIVFIVKCVVINMNRPTFSIRGAFTEGVDVELLIVSVEQVSLQVRVEVHRVEVHSYYAI